MASAGNNADGNVNCPACYDDLVIAVGTVDEHRVVAPFSNGGRGLDFVAPGIDVVSTAMTGGALAGAVVAGDGSVIFGTRVNGDTGVEVSGTIAVVDSGLTRTANDEHMAMARTAGASGVVFVNANEAPCSITITRNKVNPPAICVSKSDGALLRARAEQTATLSIFADDYTVASGTSMSAPHVTGALALLLALDRNADVERVLSDTAVDIGDPGWDAKSGYGSIDAGAAVRKIAPPVEKRRAARH